MTFRAALSQALIPLSHVTEAMCERADAITGNRLGTILEAVLRDSARHWQAAYDAERRRLSEALDPQPLDWQVLTGKKWPPGA